MNPTELCMLAKSEMDRYVDMGHFKNPEVAIGYLIDGFQLGYRKCAAKLEEMTNDRDRWQNNYQMEAGRGAAPPNDHSTKILTERSDLLKSIRAERNVTITVLQELVDILDDRDARKEIDSFTAQQARMLIRTLKDVMDE
jgi:hypothetical protein